MGRPVVPRFQRDLAVKQFFFLVTALLLLPADACSQSQQQPRDPLMPNQPSLQMASKVGLSHGPTSPKAGRTLQMDWDWNNGSNPASTFGWLWGAQAGYGGIGLARSFGPSIGVPGAPLAPLWAAVTNTGTAGDSIAAMSISYAKSNTGENFGGNDIVTSDNSLGTITLIGREIDLQPGAGNRMSGASNGLILNMWHLNNPASAISIAGPGRGKWSYGLQCASGAISNACVVAPPGVGAGMELQGSAGHSNAGSLYNSSDFVTINSGANGFAVKDQLGISNRLVVLDSSVRVGVALQLPKYAAASLPTCNSRAEGTVAGVSDAASATFNAAVRGGGSNHVLAYCNGTGWTVH